MSTPVRATDRGRNRPPLAGVEPGVRIPPNHSLADES